MRGSEVALEETSLERFVVGALIRFWHRQSPSTLRTLRHDLLDDAAVHIREPEIAARVAIGEPFVIQSQQVQHRGVQIVKDDEEGPAGKHFDTMRRSRELC